MANDTSAFRAQVWSKNIVANIDRINVMLSMCNTDYEGEIRNVGDTVQVRTFGSISLGTYTKGTPISYGDLAPTKETLVVDDSQYFAFKVDDVDKAQSDINILDGYTARAAVGISNTIESKIMSAYTLAKSQNRITGASSAAITLTSDLAYTLIVDAGQKLDEQEVAQQNRWIVVTPAYRGFLLKNTTHFIRASDLGDEVLQTGRFGSTAKNTPGFIGRISNFDVYMSTAVPNASARFQVYGQGRPFSYASQIRKMESLRLEAQFETAVRGLLLHDVTVFAEHSKQLGTIKTDV